MRFSSVLKYFMRKLSPWVSVTDKLMLSTANIETWVWAEVVFRFGCCESGFCGWRSTTLSVCMPDWNSERKKRYDDQSNQTLCWRVCREETWNTKFALPHWKRHNSTLGRNGGNLASYVLQWAKVCKSLTLMNRIFIIESWFGWQTWYIQGWSWRTGSHADWSSAQSP